MSLVDIRKRSAVLRKALDYGQQVPRAAVRISAKADEYRLTPPLVGNSFPKSGTHQLLQVLAAFPGTAHWGSFIASQPSLTFRERSVNAHVRRINRLLPGEYLGAHIFYDAAYADAMRAMNSAHFFIYRDLRDVAASEMYYLRDMNRWHRMHGYFNQLSSDDERLSAVIGGVSKAACGCDYPDIGSRMRRFLPWIGHPDTFALKYESLNSDGRETLIRQMIRFYAARAGQPVNEDAIHEAVLANLDPAKSHTFRAGGSGGWKKVFKPQHEQAFDELCGDLMEALGYAT